MAPAPRERLSRRRLALCDLILVMWEDQVDRPRMDVNGLTEDRHRHRRALEMPPGRHGPRASPTRHRMPRPQASPPSRARSLARSPWHTHPVRRAPRSGSPVCRAGTDGHTTGIVDREIDRAVVRLIGDALGDQSLDERDHLRDVGGRPRVVLRILDPQVAPIGVEPLDTGSVTSRSSSPVAPHGR